MGKVSCDLCRRQFATKFSLQRHTSRFHPDEVVSDDDDDTESVATDATMTESADETRSEKEDDDKSEESDNASDDGSSQLPAERTRSVIDDLVRATYDEYDEEAEELIDGFMKEGRSLSDARRLAYQQLIGDYRREFRRRFQKLLLQCRQLKKEPLYKAVMETADSLREVESFGLIESVKSACSKRKYLLYAEFPSDRESDGDEDDNQDNDNDIVEHMSK